ncbi:MAG: serine hydrolase [Prolixibacteraceae bacterium]|nr:serine hydrolase [Prolixibacteraceae bacterium]
MLKSNFFIRMGLLICLWSALPVLGLALVSCQTITDQEAEWKKRQQIEASLTLLENHRNLIPLARLDTLKIAVLSVGETGITEFQRMAANYLKVDFLNLPATFTSAELHLVQSKLNDFNLVLAGFHPVSATPEINQLINFLNQQKTSVITFFQKADALANLKIKSDGLILAFDNDSLTQSLSAQLIFGGIGAKGKLKKPIGNVYSAGSGIVIEKPIRLKYTLSEEIGMQTAKLDGAIDSIVNNALAKKAFPGCNVLVAKDGKIIFRKAYGYHTFEKLRATRLTDLYDLASVTKVSGGTPGILKLYDEGKIELDKPVSTYFPDWKNRLFHRSDKSDVTIRELYAHQSGLVPFIGFYKQTMENGQPSPKWYTSSPDKKHTLCVAPGMYLDKKFLKIVNEGIRKAPLKTRGKYVYSDLPLVITPQIVEHVSGKSFTSVLYDDFYKPLGASALTYNPLDRFPKDQIVPTELDNYYRFQLIQGTVHDESAAVLGGISGNAGLFASADDLAKLMQMYLQMGTYGGKQYVSEATMKEFTRVQFPQNNNRRGLIFDKPSLNLDSLKPAEAYPCPEASPESFGHSGFTGTFVWMDPKCGLLYIFLSNRVCPTRNNNLISDLNVRTEILSAIYKQMKE